MSDERNFNNFRMRKNDLSKTQGMNKLSQKGINFANPHIHGILLRYFRFVIQWSSNATLKSILFKHSDEEYI